MLKEIRWYWGEMIFPYPRNSPRKLPIFALFPSSHPPPELNEGRGFHRSFPLDTISELKNSAWLEAFRRSGHGALIFTRLLWLLTNLWGAVS